MSHLPRTAILALAGAAGALAICMVLPLFDASCPMGSDPAQPPGACAAARAGSREIALLGLVIGVIATVIILGSIGAHAVLHHRVSRALLRQARPAVVGEQPVGLVPGIGGALVAGIRRPRNPGGTATIVAPAAA